MAPPHCIVMVAYTRYPWDPRVRREAETLARMGGEVHVVCARDRGGKSLETVRGVTVHRVPLEIRRGGPMRYLYQYAAFLVLARRELRRLHRRPVTVVHAHSLPDFIAFVGLPEKARGARLILDLHEAMPEIYAARFPRARVGPKLAIAAERLSCMVADRVVVVNETIRELLATRGIPAERLVVVFNSPDLTEAAKGPSPLPFALEGRLGLVYAGTLDAERDIATLIRAAGILQRTRPVALIVYGPGPPEYLAYLHGLVEGLGLQDVVLFGGVLPSDRVLGHLANADVGIVTYERNPITEIALPNKVFEYVVLDKPLVLPDLRALRRMFDGAALFYQPGNAEDLAKMVVVAAAGGLPTSEMRQRARAACEAARWEVQAARLAAACGIAAEGPGDVGG